MYEVLEIIQPIKQPSLLYKAVIVPCAEVKKSRNESHRPARGRNGVLRHWLGVAGLCRSCDLTELVAVLLVLVHLVVRDSLAGHAAALRFVFEGVTVAPLPGPAR